MIYHDLSDLWCCVDVESTDIKGKHNSQLFLSPGIWGAPTWGVLESPNQQESIVDHPVGTPKTALAMGISPLSMLTVD